MANEITTQVDLMRPLGQQLSPQERETHRNWIAGRAFTLLSHGYQKDRTTGEIRAMAKDWCDVLEDVPREIIQRASVEFQRTADKATPTPSRIYAICKRILFDERKRIIEARYG